MKKETVIAIVLGIVAGISIAGVVILNSRNASSRSNETILSGASPTGTINTSETTPLLITSPETESVTDKSTVTLKGSAPDGALVIVQLPNEEHIAQNSSGSFSQEITLVPGENNIRVTAYDTKNIDSRTLTIYYIPAQQ